jgi:predicted helicase
MSIYAIQQYYKELEKIIHYGGTKKETAIRNSFYNLLNEFAHSKDLMLIPEISTKNKAGKLITPDGTIKDSIRNDWGYWESKDETDDINEEIKKKFEKGYPSDNILFEDSQTAVLYQHGQEVMRKDMRDEEELHKILTCFLSYERPEVHDFREAIEHFKLDIPKVTIAIREMIESQQKLNVNLQSAQAEFLEMAKASINPDITPDDVKEMMIQHILSADIFNTIFDEPHFHQENNIARELNRMIQTFFTGTTRRQALGSIKHYYDTINARAASIADHHEKQKFLKVVYENFYKGYNPKAADRLGIVYTPSEIVQFMIRSADYLLHKHFGKTLGDKNVEILDPATGTGTFITDIIDYLPKGKLKYKYKNELHANELAILPYYIANLNIEYTYKQKIGEYEQFENLCFVDTLDKASQHFIQAGLFGVSSENTTRIKRQNERKISVIIGNPPYNANQANENDNNKNREYPIIDRRIKETFIKNSTAQKTKMYDMYSRFYRWAMDRLNSNGIIAFISNRSFIESRTFDGFRKIIQQDYDYAYIIDTKSDVRANPKIAGTTHNVFGIQTGVAVLFLVKSTYKQMKINPCRIDYIAMDDFWKKEEKLSWFAEHDLKTIEFENINPDKDNNWINISNNDWDTMLRTYDDNGNSIFTFYSNGIVTARDEWVFDFDRGSLISKIDYLITNYNANLKCKDYDYRIKWSEGLKKNLKASREIILDQSLIVNFYFRPYVSKLYYCDKILSDRLTSKHYTTFGKKFDFPNQLIIFSIPQSNVVTINSTNKPIEFKTAGTATGGSAYFPRYTYDVESNQNDNITDWALDQFQTKYKDVSITKDSIFYYLYAVLHNPTYRKTYETNLKREFPRIPFYENFSQWSKWGEDLMNLHINYETATPYPFERREIDSKKQPKAKLKALKEIGIILLDENTELHGIPKEVWDYKVGNRSALEWILDQYKEKKASDPTIAEKFNSYTFADYKEHVIDLLSRAGRVSIETMRLITEMENTNG